jgi:hypothetical protein
VGAQRQQLTPPAFKLARELGDESERLRTEDLGEALGDAAADGDTICESQVLRHVGSSKKWAVVRFSYRENQFHSQCCSAL